MTDKIKSIGRSERGGQMAIIETEPPNVARDEILVEVRSAAINEMDVEIRDGKWSSYVRKYRKAGPTLTGFEFAGVARSTGNVISEGDHIVGYVHVTNGPRTHAQLISIDERCLYGIPDALSFDSAAAVVAMGLASIDVFERLKPVAAGQSILIVGAAGGLGVYSVQLAKSRSAHVVAVCSRRNADWVKSLGADEVRVYESEDALRGDDEFDLILDIPQKLSFARCRRSLKPTGMYVTTNPFKDLWGFCRALVSRRNAGFMLVLETDRAKLARLFELVDQGLLRPIIDSRFMMKEINDAMDRFAESGKQGRVLLDLSLENNA